jgi:hypothetical protein
MRKHRIGDKTIFTAKHPNEEPNWVIAVEKTPDGKYEIRGFLVGTIPKSCDFSIRQLEKESAKINEALDKTIKSLREENGSWNILLIKGMKEIMRQIDKYGYESEW